jgi:ribosomal protein L30/L7E
VVYCLGLCKRYTFVFKEPNPTTKALEKLHLQRYNNKSYAQETAFYNITPTKSQNKSLQETSVRNLFCCGIDIETQSCNFWICISFAQMIQRLLSVYKITGKFTQTMVLESLCPLTYHLLLLIAISLS